MALSMEQLEIQTVEQLPAREVMSSMSWCSGGGGWGGGHTDVDYTSTNTNILNGNHVLDGGINVLNGSFNGNLSDNKTLFII